MSDQYRHVIAHSTSSCQGHLWHERMAYFACLLHAFHNVYHKHAFTKSCLCRLIKRQVQNQGMRCTWAYSCWSKGCACSLTMWLAAVAMCGQRCTMTSLIQPILS